MEPFAKNVFIKPNDPAGVSAGGIILPQTVERRTFTGDVLAVGNKCETGIMVGDRVVFARYSGNEIELQGNTYLVMFEEAVLGRI